VHWRSILTELYLKKITQSSRRATPQCRWQQLRQLAWWSYVR